MSKAHFIHSLHLSLLGPLSSHHIKLNIPLVLEKCEIPPELTSHQTQYSADPIEKYQIPHELTSHQTQCSAGPWEVSDLAWSRGWGCRIFLAPFSPDPSRCAPWASPGRGRGGRRRAPKAAPRLLPSSRLCCLTDGRDKSHRGECRRVGSMTERYKNIFFVYFKKTTARYMWHCQAKPVACKRVVSWRKLFIFKVSLEPR